VPRRRDERDDGIAERLRADYRADDQRVRVLRPDRLQLRVAFGAAPERDADDLHVADTPGDLVGRIGVERRPARRDDDLGPLHEERDLVGRGVDNL
jgi:hypothetical protein